MLLCIGLSRESFVTMFYVLHAIVNPEGRSSRSRKISVFTRWREAGSEQDGVGRGAGGAEADPAARAAERDLSEGGSVSVAGEPVGKRCYPVAQ